MINCNVGIRHKIAIKQVDSGMDQNNNSDKVILASMMIIIRLNLVGVIPVKNTPG